MDLITLNLLQILVRFVICIAVNFIIIDRLYYPKSKRRDFYFTYMITSVAIFFLMVFMMDMKAKATMGIGIGLFGIFSIMRFRTDAMPVREMTYLFLIISLSVISAVAPMGDDDHGEIDLAGLLTLLVTDLIVVGTTAICEKRLRVLSSKLIQYDRVELAKPERYEELLSDLKERTGLDIIKVDVGGIDFLKDSVVLKVYYRPTRKGETNSVGDQFRIRKSLFRDL